MILKGIIDEDFINYKKPSMVLEFPRCDFKCDKECGQQVCQNSALASAPNINIDIDLLIQRYLSNDITSSVVMQGLEPFDSSGDVIRFIELLRYSYHCVDDVVIYTGYNKEEIPEPLINACKQYGNIIIKYGRYTPDQESHYDEVLGVNLASDNQYAERLN